MELSERVKLNNNLENTVSSIDYRKSTDSWKKSQFRKSYKWTSFVKRLISVRKCCERCHSTERLVVHHRDPRNYEDLEASKFVVLCNSCHLIIESQCKTQEEMNRHPENRKWHTFYPYKVDSIMVQSGIGTINRWNRERVSEINRPETTYSKEQIKQATTFMKEHPELFY